VGPLTDYEVWEIFMYFERTSIVSIVSRIEWKEIDYFYSIAMKIMAGMTRQNWFILHCQICCSCIWF